MIFPFGSRFFMKTTRPAIFTFTGRIFKMQNPKNFTPQAGLLIFGEAAE
jgi:hypothetical protein